MKHGSVLVCTHAVGFFELTKVTITWPKLKFSLSIIQYLTELMMYNKIYYRAWVWVVV